MKEFFNCHPKTKAPFRKTFLFELADDVGKYNTEHSHSFSSYSNEEFKSKPLAASEAKKIGINRFVSFKYVKNNK